MSVSRLFLFFVFIAGCFIYCEISPMKMIDEIISKFSGRHTTLKERIKVLKHEKKHKQFIDVILTSKKNLTINNQANLFPIYCVASVAGFVGGVTLGTAINNPFSIPVFALGFAYAPFLLIRFLSYDYQRKLNAELATALSIITTAYQSNEDIVGVIEENIRYIHSPVKEVFETFVFEVENVNPSISTGIESLRRKIDNTIWYEWCDTIILCQGNKTFRSALNPIIIKFSDVRVVSEKLSIDMYKPMKELLVMSSFLLAMPFMIYFASKEWFTLFMTTTLGQIMFAIDMAVVLINVNAGVIHSGPVEYRR